MGRDTSQASTQKLARKMSTAPQKLPEFVVSGNYRYLIKPFPDLTMPKAPPLEAGLGCATTHPHSSNLHAHGRCLV